MYIYKYIHVRACEPKISVPYISIYQPKWPIFWKGFFSPQKKVPVNPYPKERTSRPLGSRNVSLSHKFSKNTAYPLVNDHIAGWNDIPIFNRKHIFISATFSTAMLDYRSVNVNLGPSFNKKKHQYLEPNGRPSFFGGVDLNSILWGTKIFQKYGAPFGF